jgi:single-strand DNA-binding protein
MSSLNKCTFIGNLTRDPEIKYLPSSEAIANVNIACNDRWTDKTTGERKELVEYIRIAYFGKLAEIVGQYGKKGGLVYVEGSLRTRKYTDKDGVEKFATDIKGNEFRMLGGKAESAPPPQSQQRLAQRQAPRQEASGFDDFDENIPF